MFEFFITRPLGYIIQFIYNLVQNYGWAIVIFTVVVKLLLLPLQLKSQKSMKKQQKIQPIIASLQQKYANDKEKLQTEMMKVYKENNVSMSGGCLPLLIQLPILFGFYQVIQKPMKFLLRLDFNEQAILDKVESAYQRIVQVLNPATAEKCLEYMQRDDQIGFLRCISELSEKTGEFAEWVLNFNFLGLDLSRNPSASISAITSGNFDNLSTMLLILIPVVAVFTTWLSTHLMQKMSGTNNAAAGESAQSMTKSMNLMMPVLTGVFTFTLPGALGIYWIASNVMQIVTQYMLNKFLENKEDDFVVKVPEKNRNNRKKRK